MTTVMIDDVLPYVEKPSRYLGQEINSVHKPKEGVRLRAVLAFPDLYEVGMSHLGTQILYGLGNLVDGVQVERAFLPQLDMLAILKERGIPLFSLESRTPLSECHVIGITLQSELTYTNILAILDAGDIPVRASQRSGSHPLVIGGGPCAFNPEPIAEFFDLFLLGDGEEVWPLVLRDLKEITERGGSRAQMIAAAKAYPGVYDPSDFDVYYADDGKIDRIVPRGNVLKVTKAMCLNLDIEIPPHSFLVPYVQTIHDRLNIEAARGCTRGCRFCHAGMVYRPVRERSRQTLVEMAAKGLESTGYEELALTSLSIGDYGPLEPLLRDLMDAYGEDRISISLPSMRIGGLTPEVARQIQRVRKTGFTIAPEAGTRRLRKVVNKDFSDAEIIQTAQRVFERGWDSVKLYFMIGLPTECVEDLDGIVNLAKTIGSMAPKRGQITVSLSPFVPKPHTPFQWARQDPEHVLKEKLDYLRKNLRGGKVRVRWGRTDQARLEAVLARGDRRLSRVVENAWRRGAVLDGWDEHFSWNTWMAAFESESLDPGWYTERERSGDEPFPWDHLSSGVSRQYLLKEYRLGLAGEVSDDCRSAGCLSCGVCTPEQMENIPALRKTGAVDGSPPLDGELQEPEKSHRRVRFIFQKVGDMRFLGHLETMRVFERTARRANIPLAFSGGYHPKPKITFALALPVGVEGEREWADFELQESWDPQKFRETMNMFLPGGLEILLAWKTPVDGQPLPSRISSMGYRAEFPGPVHDLDSRVEILLSGGDIPVVRESKGKTKTLNLKNYLQAIESSGDDIVHFTLAMQTNGGSIRPGEVLQALMGENTPIDGIRVFRTGLRLLVVGDRSGGRPGFSRIWD